MPKARISQGALLLAMDTYTGWCSNCKDFTRDGTEPDAEDYDCPICDESSVMGAEQALLQGEFVIGE